MHTVHIVPLDPSHLPAAAHLCAHGPNALLAHVRWHHTTPYACARVALLGGTVVGLCTAVRFASTARIAQVHVHAAHRGSGIGRALVNAMVAELEAQGTACVHVDVPVAEHGFWEALGFALQHRFVRYAGGLFLEAQRDEVLLLEPVHTLALLHLDRRATGEERGPLLLEHRYAAHGFVEHGRLRGGLLPLLGHGLILADAPAVGLELQRWLLPVQSFLHVPEANAAACAHLHERGYRVEQQRVRMVRGTPPPFRPELVYAWPW